MISPDADRLECAVAAATCDLRAVIANLREENAELRGQLEAARTEIAILAVKQPHG